MKDAKFTICGGIRDSRLRLAMWRDRDFPDFFDRADWEVLTHADADQMGRHAATIGELGFCTYEAGESDFMKRAPTLAPSRA